MHPTLFDEPAHLLEHGVAVNLHLRLDAPLSYLLHEPVDLIGHVGKGHAFVRARDPHHAAHIQGCHLRVGIKAIDALFLS